MNTTHVAAYYFPNYHADPRNTARYGTGWTEWELAKQARPRYPGHQQPKIPLWGYEDEADPGVMSRKIDAAADHGINSFIFDWYYYNDGPFLQRALEEGFLGAPNRHRLKFSLMWANHNWVELFPALPGQEAELHYPGAITPATWDLMTDTIVEKYFAQLNYWKLEGKPYFSFYELSRLMESFGGSITRTKQALESFREKTRAAGFPGLHLNVVGTNVRILPGETTMTDPKEVLTALGLDSVTSYVWIHHVTLDHFPESSYASMRDRAVASWSRLEQEYPLPYYPNVTMGWDSSPRTRQNEPFLDHGYPYMPVASGNSPAEFAKALEAAKAFLDPRPVNQRILTLNAWNEWTEGSYLEPDTVNGMGYLEAIRRVFPPN